MPVAGSNQPVLASGISQLPLDSVLVGDCVDTDSRFPEKRHGFSFHLLNLQNY